MSHREKIPVRLDLACCQAELEIKITHCKITTNYLDKFIELASLERFNGKPYSKHFFNAFKKSYGNQEFKDCYESGIARMNKIKLSHASGGWEADFFMAYEPASYSRDQHLITPEKLIEHNKSYWLERERVKNYEMLLPLLPNYVSSWNSYVGPIDGSARGNEAGNALCLRTDVKGKQRQK